MTPLRGKHHTWRVLAAVTFTLLLVHALPGVAAATPAATPATVPPAATGPADPVLEARVMAVSAELRCLVCQNQTVADSHAGLAVDLRQQVRDMLRAGQSEQQVLTYMTDRYGDFVLYRPPVRSSTWLLWFGPTLLLLAGVATLVLLVRRRSRLPDHAFEDDPQDQAEVAR